MAKIASIANVEAHDASAMLVAGTCQVAQASDARLLTSIIDGDLPFLGHVSSESLNSAGADPASSLETLANAPLVQSGRPVDIYSKSDLALLQKKCSTVRAYCNGQVPATNKKAHHLGITRTLFAFEGGPEAALRSYQQAPGFEQAAFGDTVKAGQLPGATPYSCSEARADGAVSCPPQGCPLPDNTVAKAPVDLLMWECDVRQLPVRVITASITASEFGVELLGTGENLYAYDNGIFRRVDDRELQRRIYRHVQNADGSLRLVREINGILRLGHVKNVEAITPNPNFICFQNGTLDVVAKRLVPHDSKCTLLNRIPHDYDPGATCPGFLAFLNSIWQPDADRDEKIRFFQQWLGYLLCADTRMQKMVIVLGSGANGKSVALEICRLVVGEVNVGSAMLDRVRVPSVRATLDGKLLNLSADLPKHGIVSDGDLKAMIAGDPIEVSPKFMPSYTVRPYARFMAATNCMPPSRDTTEGFFRRIVVLPCNRQFTEAERDPGLLNALSLELPGIVAWAVEGLYDLNTSGSFAIPPSSKSALENYRNDLSPVRLFAHECLERSTDRSGYQPQDLFTAYRAWCHERGFGADNMIALGRSLASLGFEQRRSNGTVWLVRVKTAGEVYFSRVRAVGRINEQVLNSQRQPPGQGSANVQTAQEPMTSAVPG